MIDTPKRPLKVFLCHASADKPKVWELYNRLASESWIDPWLDVTRILPGQHWTTVIKQALVEADSVIIFVSNNSIDKEGFIQREMNYAWDLSLEKPRHVIYLIPVRLEECDLPYELKERQWADYFNEKKEETYGALLQSLKMRRDQKLKSEAKEIVHEENQGHEISRNAEHNLKLRTEHKKETQEVIKKTSAIGWSDHEIRIDTNGEAQKSDFLKASTKYSRNQENIKGANFHQRQSNREKIINAILIGLILLGVGILIVLGMKISPQFDYLISPNTYSAITNYIEVTPSPSKPVNQVTPLWMFLPVTYTPTAAYVNTPRSAQSGDQYRLALAAYAEENWDEYITNMQVIASLEPDAADVPYMIGDAYRFKGDANSALDFYNEALKINEDFGPAYLGLARARLLDDPKANVDALFEQAIELDPDFGEVYLERARYNINNNDPEAAIIDLDRADRLIPNSPTVYMIYADAYLALDDKKSALEAAETAYSLDITNLDVYKLLGKLHIESGEYERAIEALDLYVVYETEDDQVFGMLGQAYYEMGNYEVAINHFDRAEALNKNGIREFLVYKGLANLELNNLDKAVEDLEKASSTDNTSFVINLGLLRAYYLQEKFGSAFQKAEMLKSVAETDKETALMLYWRALVQEKRGDIKDAVNNWEKLLAMPEEAMTPEMRNEANNHLIMLQ